MFQRFSDIPLLVGLVMLMAGAVVWALLGMGERLRSPAFQRFSIILLLTWAALVLLLMSPILIGFYLLMRLLEEVSGEGTWYRRMKQAMQVERPPLDDAEFVRSVSAEPDDEPLWLAVRKAVSDSIGLPPEAVRPEDRLADLWRMQWMGPDVMDLVFRMEISLEISIARSALERFPDVRYGQDGEFREFAEAVVRALRETAVPMVG